MSFHTLHLVDPELQPLAEHLSTLTLTQDSLEDMREFVRSLASLGKNVPENVERSEIQIPLRDGGTTRALLYQNKAKANNCGLLHIHGGGLVSGMPETNDQRHLRLCDELGLTILAPTYRVAPEHPYPTPLNDCIDGWAWLHSNAARLGIDSAKMALSGDSAGGCLAASMSHHIRDEGGGPIAHLMLIYPMLDAATGIDQLDPLLGQFGWTAEMNQFSWNAYLGNSKPDHPGVPSALADLTNLPPCWIGVGSLDLFLDENIDYARRLISAGINTEFKIYPGAIHGFPLIIESRVAEDFYQDYASSLERSLGLRNE